MYYTKIRKVFFIYSITIQTTLYKHLKFILEIACYQNELSKTNFCQDFSKYIFYYKNIFFQTSCHNSLKLVASTKPWVLSSTLA